MRGMSIKRPYLRGPYRSRPNRDEAALIVLLCGFAVASMLVLSVVLGLW